MLKDKFTSNQTAQYILKTTLSVIIQNVRYCNTTPIKITGLEVNQDLVKQVYLKLNYHHIEYVLINILKSQTTISDLYCYLQSCLFNSYYHLKSIITKIV